MRQGVRRHFAPIKDLDESTSPSTQRRKVRSNEINTITPEQIMPGSLVSAITLGDGTGSIASESGGLQISGDGTVTLAQIDTTTSGVSIFIGTGTPEAVVTASVGSLFLRTDGGASTTLYVKESGTGNTGWVAK